MKKKVLLLIIASFMITGVVSAATLWGTYKGNQIIRISVDGVPVKVSDAPAVLMDGRTMIPIYLLNEAGIQYSWDQKNQTVNIVSQKAVEVVAEPKPDTLEKLTIKDIYKQSVGIIGYVDGLDNNGDSVCTGSGVMVYPNYFVTNHHVAHCGGTGRVKAKIDGSTYNNGTEAWYMFDNETVDLTGMIISTSFDSKGYSTGAEPPTVFNIVLTELPEIGDKVYAIGSPYGLENTVSEGVVSGIRTIDGMTYIQHTCNTTHGSSGGALLDENGYLIGITSSGYDGTNLNFAIPISYVQDEIDKLEQ
jgi:S1-C subfamily serine protease